MHLPKCPHVQLVTSDTTPVGGISYDRTALHILMKDKGGSCLPNRTGIKQLAKIELLWGRSVSPTEGQADASRGSQCMRLANPQTFYHL
jgi:hypothetical protein